MIDHSGLQQRNNFLEKERDRLVRDHDLHLREIRRLNVKIEELETKESGFAVFRSTGV